MYLNCENIFILRLQLSPVYFYYIYIYRQVNFTANMETNSRFTKGVSHEIIRYMVICTIGRHFLI